MRTSGLQGLQDKPGGIFLRRADIMPEADRILLHAVARVVIVTERGPSKINSSVSPLKNHCRPLSFPVWPPKPIPSQL